MTWSNLHLPGIPVDWPGGLENIYEINGLVLNNNHAGPDRYKITKIDGLFDAEVRDVRESNTDRHGETAYTSYYGGKQITIEGLIIAGNLTKLRNMIADLQRAFSDLVEQPMYIYDYAGFQVSMPKVYIVCKKVSPIVLEEANNSRKMQRAFQITLRASDPFVYSTDESWSAFYVTGAANTGRTYDKEFDYSYRNIALEIDKTLITNNGTTDILPRFKIHGPATQPILAKYQYGGPNDGDTLQVVIINQSISAGDYIEYNLENNTLTRSNGESIMISLDPASDNLFFAPGTYGFGFGDPSGVAGQTGIEIYYRDKYI